jgi:scyllo-inositol 2-dehydrogenase (NADP+)
VIKTAMVGLGKMGLSHLAIFRSHPSLDIVAACDTSKYLTDVLGKHTGLSCHDSFDRMLEVDGLRALIVATPSSLHAQMVHKALERGLHVFCEKPFVIKVSDGEALVASAESRGLVNQVGYHYRFVGAFREAARIVKSGALGSVHHMRAEAYGPVVLRAKGTTWRSQKTEGGGALYDYACHAIDLANFVVGAAPSEVHGVVRRPVFSADVDDEVYCSFRYADGASGQLCVNWSDESFRKMSTKISVWGTNGRIVADRQECQVYLRKPHESLPGFGAGWTVKYTTDLTEEVWYYLRGEEYSAQVDHFARNIADGRTDGENTFRSALETDKVVQKILDDESGVRVAAPVAAAQGDRKGLLGRIFG